MDERSTTSSQAPEKADIDLAKTKEIGEIQKNVGEVNCTLYTGTDNQPFPLTGQESTVTISLNDCPVLVPPSLIGCSLTPPDDSQPIQCSVKESTQSGQYNIVFTPVTRGLHQLHVRVNDIEISGSPMSIPVSVPPEKRGTPVKTITGLRGPAGIALTDDGRMIVCERDRDTIIMLDKERKAVKSFGNFGVGRAQVKSPKGVAISSKGTILVTNSYNNWTQEFTMDGKCIAYVGSNGDDPLQFYHPCGIAVSKTTGKIYIAEQNNHRVQVLNSDMTFSHMFGSKGSGQGQFKRPNDIKIDNQDFVYVADHDNHRIQKFTLEGQFVYSFGTMYNPTGLTVDDNGLVYVNCENDYVSVFTTDGQYRCRIKKYFSEKKSYAFYLTSLLGVAMDRNGDLYVCCDLDKQIKVF